MSPTDQTYETAEHTIKAINQFTKLHGYALTKRRSKVHARKLGRSGCNVIVDDNIKHELMKISVSRRGHPGATIAHLKLYCSELLKT